MNYTRYIPEWQEVQAVIHQHWLVVFDKFLLWLLLGAVFPSFLYYQSYRIQDIIPFIVIEVILLLVFIKIVYELFNWYNDVWIITNEAVYALEWSLLKTNVESVHHGNIEGIEIDRNRIWDSIFNKWDIIIKKFWDEEVAILDAYNPYEAVSVIDTYIHPEAEESEDEQDRFDMVMDALSWVVKDFLERKWYPEKQDVEISEWDIETEITTHDNWEDDDYTLDIRK